MLAASRFAVTFPLNTDPVKPTATALNRLKAKYNANRHQADDHHQRSKSNKIQHKPLFHPNTSKSSIVAACYALNVVGQSINDDSSRVVCLRADDRDNTSHCDDGADMSGWHRD